jgi:hypothetical protein
MANNRVILQAGSFAGAILGTYDIFGSNAGSETVTVFDNTIANFQGDFARGGDIIRLNDTATDFTIRINGSNVEIFSASAGITALVPIGIAGTAIGFQTGTNTFTDTRTLIFDGTNVVLGGQVVTGTAAAVNPVAPPAGPEIYSLTLDDAVALPPPAGPQLASLKEIDVPQAAAFAVSEPAVVHFSVPEPVTIDYKAAFELGMTSAVIHFA